MPNFRIVGIAQRTQKKVEFVVGAESYRGAERKANDMGIVVSDIYPVSSSTHKQHHPPSNDTKSSDVKAKIQIRTWSRWYWLLLPTFPLLMLFLCNTRIHIGGSLRPGGWLPPRQPWPIGGKLFKKRLGGEYAFSVQPGKHYVSIYFRWFFCPCGCRYIQVNLNPGDTCKLQYTVFVLWIQHAFLKHTATTNRPR